MCPCGDNRCSWSVLVSYTSPRTSLPFARHSPMAPRSKGATSPHHLEKLPGESVKRDFSPSHTFHEHSQMSNRNTYVTPSEEEEKRLCPGCTHSRVRPSNLHSLAHQDWSENTSKLLGLIRLRCVVRTRSTGQSMPITTSDWRLPGRRNKKMREMLGKHGVYPSCIGHWPSVPT